MTTIRCDSEMVDASNGAQDHAQAGIVAGWKKPARQHGSRAKWRRQAVFAPQGEMLHSFLDGMIIGLAIVGPVAVLDAAEHGFVWLLVLWGVLGLAGAALHRLRRGPRQSDKTDWDGRDE